MKSILFPFVALLLVLAISASPIIPLLDTELGKTMVISATEEEQSSETITFKKLDEADIYHKYLLELAHQPTISEPLFNFLGYIFPVSDYTVETLDPPPRSLV